VGLGKLYNGARKWNKAAHGKSIFSAAATACRDEAGVENHHPLGFGDFAEITQACAEG
jgi:hypothetical protein